MSNQTSNTIKISGEYFIKIFNKKGIINIIKAKNYILPEILNKYAGLLNETTTELNNFIIDSIVLTNAIDLDEYLNRATIPNIESFTQKKTTSTKPSIDNIVWTDFLIRKNDAKFLINSLIIKNKIVDPNEKKEIYSFAKLDAPIDKTTLDAELLISRKDKFDGS